MRSCVLLLAAAAASHAFLYDMDGSPAPAMVKSRHFKRGTHLGESSKCSPDKIPDHVKFATLNTTDVAIIENMLLSWTNDASTQLQNTGGSKGQVVTSNGVDGQVCNLSHNPQHIDSNALKILFDRIDCGGRDQPQMGYGYTGDNGGYYVGYGPTGQLPNCSNDKGSIGNPS